MLSLLFFLRSFIQQSIIYTACSINQSKLLFVEVTGIDGDIRRSRRKHF